jgi:hypothetical protein
MSTTPRPQGSPRPLQGEPTRETADDPTRWLTRPEGRPGRPATPLLGFIAETFGGSAHLLVVQPNDSWRQLRLGRDAVKLIAVHRDLAPTFRTSDLVFVADLTLSLTETSGCSQPWPGQHVDLGDALASLYEVAHSRRVAALPVAVAGMDLALVSSACRTVTVYQPELRQDAERADHIDRLKATILRRWATATQTVD